jgi:hypothetical protein
MKKLVLPLVVFALGLFVADYFFGIDVPALFEGFGSFLVNILKGGNR